MKMLLTYLPQRRKESLEFDHKIKKLIVKYKITLDLRKTSNVNFKLGIFFPLNFVCLLHEYQYVVSVTCDNMT